jgi:hypothetical protein
MRYRYGYTRKRASYRNYLKYSYYSALVILILFLLGVSDSAPCTNNVYAVKNEREDIVKLDQSGTDGNVQSFRAQEIDLSHPALSRWKDDLDSGMLTADSGVSLTESYGVSTSSRISIDVRDANILDVLSVLAIKLDAHIIYLEAPVSVTFSSKGLSPITTLQLLLQKEKLDYITLGNHYIIGKRERLHEDFFNRMTFSRYSLQYISPTLLYQIISELDLPVEHITVMENSRAIYVQGTPIALSKVRELVNLLDRHENAHFDTGGERKIRMPVARAEGPDAVAALQAQRDFLQELITNVYFSDEKPRVYPYDLYWGISPDLSGSGANKRVLWVEGRPDDIDKIRKMISEIRYIEEP